MKRHLHMLRLARTQYADAGQCSFCNLPAVLWERTGMNPARLLVAGRACEAHERDLLPALRSLTITEIVSLIPAGRKAARASAALRKAAKLEKRSRGLYAASAAWRGASSATHAAALHGGAAEAEAEALRAFAAALLAETA